MANLYFSNFSKFLVSNEYLPQNTDFRGARGALVPTGGPLKTTYSKRNILVGDSAGMVNPITGGGMSAAIRQADELIDLAGLSHLRDQPAKNLSGGQQALLQIARGFMVDDIQLYLLDEPFAGVNPVIKESINRLLWQSTWNQKRMVYFPPEL